MKIKGGFFLYEPLFVGDTVIITSIDFTKEEKIHIGFGDSMKYYKGRQSTVEDVVFIQGLNAHSIFCSNGYWWPERILQKLL